MSAGSSVTNEGFLMRKLIQKIFYSFLIYLVEFSYSELMKL